MASSGQENWMEAPEQQLTAAKRYVTHALKNITQKCWEYSAYMSLYAYMHSLKGHHIHSSQRWGILLFASARTWQIRLRHTEQSHGYLLLSWQATDINRLSWHPSTILRVVRNSPLAQPQASLICSPERWAFKPENFTFQHKQKSFILTIEFLGGKKKICPFSDLEKRNTIYIWAKCCLLIVPVLTSPEQLMDLIIGYLFSIPLGISPVLHMQMPHIRILKFGNSEYDFLEAVATQHLSVWVTDFFLGYHRMMNALADFLKLWNGIILRGTFFLWSSFLIQLCQSWATPSIYKR